jgi:redox-regulated HSP33 family molecular chaperone
MAWPKGVPRKRKEIEVATTTEQQTDRELVADVMPSTGSNDLVTAFLTAMRQMSTENRETTLAAIQELKKLSPEDQEKADREKQQLMEQTLRRVEAAKAQEAEIAERQEKCLHTMPNGQTNFRGQVLSNGWAHVFCSHCHKGYDFEATDVEANKSGLNVDKWGPNAHAIIRSRVAASKKLTPPPVPKVPAGATIIFG